jgi:hypothetical protein
MENKMKKSKEQLRIIADLKKVRGIDRKVFFENGGDLARYRGLGFVQKNKKKYSRKTKHNKEQSCH